MQTPFELDALSNAHRYQKWIFESVEPYLGKRVLELGSGIGNLSQWLPEGELLVLSEVDANLIHILKSKFDSKNRKNTVILQMDLGLDLIGQVAKHELDTIVSFNVMEHIEKDVLAIQDQVRVLRESKATGVKRVVIFVPAFNFAFGSLDIVFKHFRRYDAKMLRKIFSEIDSTLKPQIHYFNILSFPGWILQGKVLKKEEIKKSQIKIIEMLIPFWKPIDHLLTRTLKIPIGQSVICVVNVE